MLPAKRPLGTQGPFVRLVVRAVASQEGRTRRRGRRRIGRCPMRIAVANIATRWAGLRPTGSPVNSLCWLARLSGHRHLDAGSRDHLRSPESLRLAGRLISVNLPGDGSCVNVRLEGQINNATPTMSRDVRIGIEFVRLSETEQAITAVLSVMSDVLVVTHSKAGLERDSRDGASQQSGDAGEKGRGLHGRPQTKDSASRRPGPASVTSPGSHPTMWRDCEVIDISMFGLGINARAPAALGAGRIAASSSTSPSIGDADERQARG